MAMLAGVINRVEMTAELFSYHVPTYFGMICAGFRRNDCLVSKRQSAGQ